MSRFQRKGLFSILIVVALVCPSFSSQEHSFIVAPQGPSSGMHITSLVDSWTIQDYKNAIVGLFSVFNYFNLSSYGGGWQVEVWDNFSDFAWSYGKKAYFDAQCILGLVEAYRFTENETYLNYAEDIWTWDRSHFWDPTYGGYYERLSHDNSVESGNKRLWFQCLSGIALVKLFSATGNNSYLEYAEELLDFVNENYYDASDGSYYTTLSSTLDVIEDMNDINDIAWCARFLLELYNVTGYVTVKDQAAELIDNFLVHMYDSTYGWFYNRVAGNWTTIIKDSKGWYDNYRMLIDAYRILGNSTYLEYAKQTFDDIQQAKSSAGYLMEMNREWTSYVTNEIIGEKDPNTAIGYLWTGAILANNTILNEAFRFKTAIYNDLLDTTYGGIYMRRKANGEIDTWKQWLAQGLVLEMLSTFAGFLTFPDTIVPCIENTCHEPMFPFDTDMVTVRTHVRDVSGISSVNVSFRINDGNWSSLKLSHLQDDLYEYTFNALHAGDTIDYYLIAVDGSDNHNIALDNNDGANYSFYVQSNDWTGPSISNVVQYPSKPTVDDVIKINATIRDVSGVHSATLHYRVNTGDWQGLSMEYASGDIFCSELSSFEPGNSIHYYISAQDNSLNHNTAINDNLGAYYQFLVAPRDTTPPVIQSVAQEPEHPAPDDPIVIRVNVTDAIEVTSVILSYTVNSNPDWTNLTMSKNQGLWIAILPALDSSSTVSYQIIAYDRLGNYVVSDIHNFIVEMSLEERDIVILASGIVIVTASLISVIGLVIIVKEIRIRRDFG